MQAEKSLSLCGLNPVLLEVTVSLNNKKMIALNSDAMDAGQEWLVDERYQLIYDLLLKYEVATKA